jgi:hypothetical protein
MDLPSYVVKYDYYIKGVFGEVPEKGMLSSEPSVRETGALVGLGLFPRKCDLPWNALREEFG